MVNFADVLAFDPEQVAEIFKICNAHEQTCSTLSTHLKGLDRLQTWTGDAADAARLSVGRKRVDIDSHGTESWKIAAAARDGLRARHRSRIGQSHRPSPAGPEHLDIRGGGRLPETNR